MSRTTKTMLVLLILISTPLTVMLFRPDLVLTSIARSTLSELGYEISSIDVNHLGINSMALDRLVLTSDDQQVVISRLHAQYSLSQLLTAKARSLSIGKIELLTFSITEPTERGDYTTLASMLESFDTLPISQMSLPNVELVDQDQTYRIGLGIESPPLRLAGEAQFTGIQDTLFDFDIQRKGSMQFTAETKILIDGTIISTSDIDLDIAEDTIKVAALSSVSVDPVQAQFKAYFPAQTAVLNDKLTLQSNFEMQEELGFPSITQLSLLLDSPSSSLQVSQTSDLGSNALQLRLPITMQGKIETTSGEMQLTLGEIFANGSWHLEDATSQNEHSFENTELRCTSFTNCDLQSDWQSKLISWRFGEYLGENTSLSAPLRFNYSNNEMRLAAQKIQITAPSIRGSTESAILEVATSLELDEMEFRVGDVISGGFDFNSKMLRLDNRVADILNPSYSGKLQLEDDTLTGILEIDLDQRLRLGVGLQHFFLRDTGDVVLQLAAHEFTEAEPLSTLIDSTQLEADIVAGQIEGLANISWSKQQDQSWRFGGPVALKIDQLSGYYEDYLFVDLSTNLFAEATTPLGIQVANPASASLSRVDLGLPFENLSWQYRFDTLNGELQIIDFQTDLLGGKLSVPAANYDAAGERQQVDVILANLRVDSLISLADYPELEADGLISGYLPLVIEGDTISIEKGLVGALKPGGSIRYTPANPTASSNQSLQLVNDALSNYQYQTMNTEVFYSEEGELLLNVQLQGSNPDMNNGQAINLNVNISDNIPSLLKSLQASRVITDELDRLVNQP